MKDEEEKIKPSKTEQKKKAQEELLNAKNLSKLSQKQINQLDYCEEVKEELLKLIKIKSNSARNRQIKYIAKLLRSQETINDNK